MSEARNLLKDLLEWHKDKLATNTDFNYIMDEVESYLSKTEQEPVLYVDKRKFEFSQSNELDGTHLNNGLLTFMTKNRVHDDDVPLYTEPPARKPLSDDEILRLWTGDTEKIRPVLGKNKVISFARAIEKAHGI